METSVEIVHRSWLGAMCLLECARGDRRTSALELRQETDGRLPRDSFGRLWWGYIGIDEDIQGTLTLCKRLLGLLGEEGDPVPGQCSITLAGL